MKRIVTAALAGALLGSASVADAATITRSFEFYAMIFDPGAPFSSLNGQFTVTFDPSASSAGSLDKLTFSPSSLNLTTANTGFSYSYSGPFSLMTVGGTAGGVGTVATNASDFVLRFTGAGSDPFSYLPQGFSYSDGSGKSWSGDFQISIASTPPGVPEPATWGLMVLGLGAIGAAMRRQRQTAMRCAAG